MIISALVLHKVFHHFKLCSRSMFCISWCLPTSHLSQSSGNDIYLDRRKGVMPSSHHHILETWKSHSWYLLSACNLFFLAAQPSPCHFATSGQWLTANSNHNLLTPGLASPSSVCPFVGPPWLSALGRNPAASDDLLHHSYRKCFNGLLRSLGRCFCLRNDANENLRRYFLIRSTRVPYSSLVSACSQPLK